MTAFDVSPDRLRWKCASSLIPFECTSDMIPLADFIGQERAIRAIEFGLGVKKPGFNIFVNGLTGTGKTTIIKAFLQKALRKLRTPKIRPKNRRYIRNGGNLGLKIGKQKNEKTKN